MNFTTHVMFGIVVAAILFGRPEIMLLVGIGSAIPDLDREYGFFSEDAFRKHQIHRAVCHNFIFLGLLYLVSPFLALGAFLHTFLDALTTARDRGVEWLYPFSRFVGRAVYDTQGNRLVKDLDHKIYFNVIDPLNFTKKTTEDLKPDPTKQQPWRRTYGPALSGRLLDRGLFLGSVALFLLFFFFSYFGIYPIIDLSPGPLPLSFTLPVALAVVGGTTSYIAGEVDRRKFLKGDYNFQTIYRFIFAVTLAMLILAIMLAAIMNPKATIATVHAIPFIGIGIGLIIFIAVIVIKVSTTKIDSRRRDNEPTIV